MKNLFYNYIWHSYFSKSTALEVEITENYYNFYYSSLIILSHKYLDIGGISNAAFIYNEDLKLPPIVNNEKTNLSFKYF